MMVLYSVWGLIIFSLSLVFQFMGIKFMVNNISILVEGMFIFLGLDLSIYFYFDWMSLLFIGVVLFISSMVLFYSCEYMSDDPFYERFVYLVLLFVFSMVLMVMSPHMILILLGWDGLGLVSYCLVIHYLNENSASAGMLTVLTNRIGDVGMLMGVVFMGSCSSWSFMDFSFNEKVVFMVGLCLMLGAVTKSAQMPFSAWLPAAMAAPTPVSSLVHSSTLVTAGVYLMIRLSVFFQGGIFSGVLLYMGMVTMFMAGLAANFESDLKKIIALSTLSQLGVMMVSVSVGYSDLAFFHLITHALFKAMLFLSAGVIIHSSMGIQDLRLMGLMGNLSPFISFMMVLASLALSGFPFLSGFYSKDLILEMLYLLNVNIYIFILLIMATMFTVTYSLRLFYYSFFKFIMSFVNSNYSESAWYLFPIYVMSFMVILFGCLMMWLLFPNPYFMFFSLEVKLLNLVLILLGVFSLLLWFMYKSNYMMMVSYIYFISKMWSVNSITEFIKKFFKFGYLFNRYDQNWMEALSGMGAVKLVEGYEYDRGLSSIKAVLAFMFLLLAYSLF
uniref:NADH-ubiquinone oxidoreductase chain 5 n=1 Tax=Stylochyrus rarior TaxID=679428 RepID=D0UY37_STYRA|nr:NADH dehydrogenase subunit 5 [Stylochyrus rarior]ACY35981.1 NADH dehydrogenase subunit 5 [Stylochyrus rarior]